MEITVKPKANLLFSSYLLLFVIVGNQVGIGVMGFQRIIFREAGHDSWISVIIAGISTHLVAWVMLKTLDLYGSTDLYGIHEDVYGKWLGRIFSSLYIAFLLMGALIVLRNYIEVVQTWMFPDAPAWLFAVLLLFLMVYGVSGGIRVIVGFCFLSLFFTIWMLLLLIYPYQYAEWIYLSPVMEASMIQLLKGAKEMTLTIVGFEILYFIFPFLKEKEKAGRYTHLGLLLTTCCYLLIMIVSTIYYSEDQILQAIWTTFMMFNVIQLPFLERFEFVGISLWILAIMPNLLLYTWAATRGMKRIFQWKQKHALYLFTIVLFGVSIFLNTRLKINALNDFSGKFSFYIVYVYPFILFIIAWFRKWLKRKI
ncbi:GerAB/ArcD/ProY family transporter [Ammoniphilus resinae]|uniref:Spore germination protein (Amino acid permease) n=1 Tax=Ammoniphilus resinae TaxID=861532 RepID=A0ABS4GLG1_9BACL|nr:GerAB/ArcD/ProY family transporter [Ammoniphilus resinae]MBP1931079.1 spore germination protein (amino acid permease) [Ammoniphilus resinae]